MFFREKEEEKGGKCFDFSKSRNINEKEKEEVAT